MHVIDLDIETFSTVELKKANVYAYVECPMFEIILCSYSVDDGEIFDLEGEQDIMDALRPWLLRDDVVFVAHNAGFERVCFSRAMGLPVGEYLDPDQWFDTAAVAALNGLPRSLDGAARTLKVTPKDSAGADLIGLFCKPYRGRRVMPHERPEKWRQFKRYCHQDTGTMREVRHKLRGWPADGFERALWRVDQRINDRGMRVDMPLAVAAVEAAKANTAIFREEITRVTAEVPFALGVDNPNSTQKLGRWTESRGFPMPNWQEETVKDALGRSDVPDDVRKVLEIRQELALVAHRKYEAVVRGASSDGRLRGQFVYHQAHTGRWASKGVQVHNLPKLSFERVGADGEKVYDEIAEAMAILDVMSGLGATPETLKKMVRPMFLLMGLSSDFSAIEARVLAWLSGEDWVLRAFLEGRDLYVENASRMGGGMGRPDGKIAVLAGGYQGSVGSLRNMGYGGRRCGRDTIKIRKKDDAAERARKEAAQEASHLAEAARDPKHKCDAEVKKVVDAYRAANPRTVEFWYDMQDKFWTGGSVGAGHVKVEVRGADRWVHLPSGRVIVYRGVRKRPKKQTEEDIEEGRPVRREMAYRHVQGYEEGTYGGRLTENVTQAVARDLLADALLRLDAAGYPIVGHVHDEALVESQDEDGVRAIMRQGPDWAEGLPLDASCTPLVRYRKD